MGSVNSIKELENVIDHIRSIDNNALIRDNLGEESLRVDIAPLMEIISSKMELAQGYSTRVHDSAVNGTAQIFNKIYKILEEQSKRDASSYISNKASFLTSFSQELENLGQYWPHFICAAIESRGFLEDEGIRKEYQRSVDTMKLEASSAIEDVRIQSGIAIDQAKQLAKEIEDRARRTAAKISVEEAQNQFKAAQDDLKKKVKISATFSVITAALFVGIALYLFDHTQPPIELGWHVIYYTSIRLLILGVAGGAAAFCLRIFRAYMHMNQMNLHRQRVANSIEAFVESAVTPEQRDLILMRCVDAVVSFGPSGLLPKDRNEDPMPLQRIPVEIISKCVTGAQQSR